MDDCYDATDTHLAKKSADSFECFSTVCDHDYLNPDKDVERRENSAHARIGSVGCIRGDRCAGESESVTERIGRTGIKRRSNTRKEEEKEGGKIRARKKNGTEKGS